MVGTLGRVDSGLSDAAELFGLARADNDDTTLLELGVETAKIEKDIAALEFRRMFSNPLDPNNCYGGWADGWIWGYGDICGGCVAIDYRCHDGRTIYCPEQCASWITICRKTLTCYRN